MLTSFMAMEPRVTLETRTSCCTSSRASFISAIIIITCFMRSALPPSVRTACAAVRVRVRVRVGVRVRVRVGVRVRVRG